MTFAIAASTYHRWSRRSWNKRTNALPTPALPGSGVHGRRRLSRPLSPVRPSSRLTDLTGCSPVPPPLQESGGLPGSPVLGIQVALGPVRAEGHLGQPVRLEVVDEAADPLPVGDERAVDDPLHRDLDGGLRVRE